MSYLRGQELLEGYELLQLDGENINTAAEIPYKVRREIPNNLKVKQVNEKLSEIIGFNTDKDQEMGREHPGDYYLPPTSFPFAERIVKMHQFKLKHLKRFQQLSSREIEVLTLLANGYNNPRIAKHLFISRHTVETHRKNLKRKLKLRSLRDLMRYAFAFDLLEV